MRQALAALLAAMSLAGGCTCGAKALRDQPQLAIVAGATGSALDFGQVALGSTRTLTVSLENIGSVAFIPTVSAIAGDSLFWSRPTGLGSLAGEQNAPLSVTFKPERLGLARAGFTVTCPGCDSFAVEVSGVGVGSGESGACALTATPAQLVFPPAPTGHAETLATNLTNSGKSDCDLSLELDPAGDAAFTLPGNFARGVLAPGKTLAATVVFTAPPSATIAAAHHGTLLVSSGGASQALLGIPLVATDEDAGYAATPWPKWHRTSGNSGLSYVDTSGTTGRLAWRALIGGAPNGSSSATYLASPSIGLGGVVYQAGFGQSDGDPGTFVALEPDGSEKWRISITPPEATCAESTPTVAADGSVYLMTGGDGVKSGGDQFFHLAAEDGHVIWSTKNQHDGFDSSPGLAPDGTLYVLDDDTKQVQAFKDDKLVWDASACDPSEAGEPQCPGQLGGGQPETFAGALAADGSSFWATQGSVTGLSPAGIQTWTETLGGGKGKAAAALGDDGLVYVGELGTAASGDSTLTLYALNPADGTTRWSASVDTGASGASSGGMGGPPGDDVASGGFSSPAMTPDGSVVVGAFDGLHAFSPPSDGSSTGTERWHVAGDLVVSSPAVGGDGTIYFGSTDGNLYAVDASGNPRWKYAIGAAVNSSPAIGADATIYVMADDGYLYAVR